jgi:hypothetical protein
MRSCHTAGWPGNAAYSRWYRLLRPSLRRASLVFLSVQSFLYSAHGAPTMADPANEDFDLTDEAIREMPWKELRALASGMGVWRQEGRLAVRRPRGSHQGRDCGSRPAEGGLAGRRRLRGCGQGRKRGMRRQPEGRQCGSGQRRRCGRRGADGCSERRRDHRRRRRAHSTARDGGRARLAPEGGRDDRVTAAALPLRVAAFLVCSC